MEENTNSQKENPSTNTSVDFSSDSSPRPILESKAKEENPDNVAKDCQNHQGFVYNVSLIKKALEEEATVSGLSNTDPDQGDPSDADEASSLGVTATGPEVYLCNSESPYETAPKLIFQAFRPNASEYPKPIPNMEANFQVEFPNDLQDRNYKREMEVDESEELWFKRMKKMDVGNDLEWKTSIDLHRDLYFENTFDLNYLPSEIEDKRFLLLNINFPSRIAGTGSLPSLPEIKNSEIQWKNW